MTSKARHGSPGSGIIVSAASMLIQVVRHRTKSFGGPLPSGTNLIKHEDCRKLRNRKGMFIATIETDIY